ncbi:MAG: hypothetical protein M3N93_00270 [Acidobacteriota bacterium]|nr:hypothetical protein [Acidobacteriota bacterium]
MRGRDFLARRQPPLTRILLIESGSRALIENLMVHLRATWGAEVPIDLVTCYAGLPAGFDPSTVVFRVTDYASPESRKELMRLLRSRGYSVAGMICSAEPIMTKWKWLIAMRLPARFFIVNENGDYFWVHRENAATIRHFMLVRAGLSGAGAIHTIGRLLIFPFSVLFLLLYAFTAHSGRLLRRALNPAKL